MRITQAYQDGRGEVNSSLKELKFMQEYLHRFLKANIILVDCRRSQELNLVEFGLQGFPVNTNIKATI